MVKPISAGGATQMRQKHRIRVIESESNAIFKDLKKLLGGRGVKKQGQDPGMRDPVGGRGNQTGTGTLPGLDQQRQSPPAAIGCFR